MIKLINGACLEEMKNISDGSVGLSITSPPYKDKDGYSDTLIEQLGIEIFRVLKDNSLFFLNFGHLAAFKTRPFTVCLLLEKAGFTLLDTIVWEKNHYTPSTSDKRLNNLWEYIFMFCKNSNPRLDRLSIGIPYKDKSNINRYGKGKDLKCGGNIWRIPYKTINNKKEKLHKDRFPIELPERCIKLSNIDKNTTVLDPFMGSGSTGIACKNLNCSFIGIELNKKYFKIAKDRILQKKKQFKKFKSNN